MSPPDFEENRPSWKRRGTGIAVSMSVVGAALGFAGGGPSNLTAPAQDSSQARPQADDASPRPKTSYAALGVSPAGLVPEVFAPGIVSLKDRYEYGIAISEDGGEVYFGVAGDVAEIRSLKFKSGQWSPDQSLIPGATFSFNDPFLSKTGDRLYFISDAAVTGGGRKRDHDIWFVQREGKGWSDPIHGGTVLNTPFEEYFVSLTDDGTLYFSSNRTDEGAAGESASFDLYTSALSKGAFAPAQKLPVELNTKHYEADVFVAPDGSYVIFCATRPDGLGRGDL
ncbi:MAG: hypothetical protein AAGG01_06420, partial [Planctomycetota bacterium]